MTKRNIIVTRGTRGIGSAIVETLAAEGHRVGIQSQERQGGACSTCRPPHFITGSVFTNDGPST
jgi:NAD(P)-dependent dehydrogenase (short-subunit alcohol dehydrogenase family)